jgi:uncharacterized protein (DUF2141 family)
MTHAFKRLAALPMLCGALLIISAGQLAAQTPATPAPAPGTSTITVRITGIRNATGKIRASLFRDAKGFPQEIASAVALQEADIDPKTLTAQIVFEKVPQGVYAISLFHDENLNGNIDFDSIGIPLEGYGFSNNPEKSESAPAPNEAKFTVNQAESAIEIKLIYWQ